jgi:hypothetical protein
MLEVGTLVRVIDQENDGIELPDGCSMFDVTNHGREGRVVEWEGAHCVRVEFNDGSRDWGYEEDLQVLEAAQVEPTTSLDAFIVPTHNKEEFDNVIDFLRSKKVELSPIDRELNYNQLTESNRIVYVKKSESMSYAWGSPMFDERMPVVSVREFIGDHKLVVKATLEDAAELMTLVEMASDLQKELQAVQKKLDENAERQAELKVLLNIA